MIGAVAALVQYFSHHSDHVVEFFTIDISH